MVLTRVEVATPAEFDAALETHRSKADRLFALFTGEKSASGRSWCGDCTRADPVIDKALEESKEDSTLLVCNVARSEYAGQPKYAYRTHAKIGLTAVPTLIRFGATLQSIGKCVEDQCADIELVEELVA